MNYSIRRRLLAALSLSTVLIWGVSTYSSYMETRENIAKSFDAELSRSARVLMALVKSSVNEGALPERWKETQLIKALGGHSPGHQYERKLAFQLWTTAGRLVLRSSTAPYFPLAETDHGFNTTQMDEQSWHVFSFPDDDGQFIAHVAQRDDIRGELIDDITIGLIKQVIIGFPLMTVVIWVIVGRSLKPVKKLVKEIEKQNINQLTPLREGNIPTELKPLINEFNSLIERVKKGLENERRFTSDAAHELRTPLAGIKTQAQVAIKADDEKGRTHALLKMSEAIDRLSHTVDQLLILARIDPKSELFTAITVNLAECMTQMAADMEPLAFKKNIDLSLEPTDKGEIFANVIMLNVMLRNLIDNAIRYTPEGGQIKISIKHEEKSVQFRIDDSGPGVPDDQKLQVLQRFYRNVETASQTTGSGLGLSIVERIAKLHYAELKMEDSNLGGLRVKVIFRNCPPAT